MSDGDPCAWCGDPSVTEVITVPGHKKRRTAPVCEVHAHDFEERGQMTLRLEVDRKIEAERKRRSWNPGTRPWR